MRVLFYGSLDSEQARFEEQSAALGRIVVALLRRSHQVFTREGETNESWSESRWKAADNIVLDYACRTRDEEQLDPQAVISFADTDEYDNGKFSPHARPIRIMPVPDRLRMYEQLLEETDILILVGGREGVSRISIVARILRVPIVPLRFAGGATSAVYRELLAEQSPSLRHDYLEFFGSAAGPTSSGAASAYVSAAERLAKEAPDRKPAALDIDVSALRVRQLIESLTLGQGAAIIAAALTLVGAVFGVGFFFGQLGGS